MTTFILAKLKIYYRQSNIDKNRVASHELLQNIKSEHKFDILFHFKKINIFKLDVRTFWSELQLLRFLHST